MRYELQLPFPPSTNAIWRAGFKRVYRSDTYVNWISQADAAYYHQYSRKRPQKLGNFTILIVLDATRRGRSDGDNRIKALLDFVQRVGFVADDRGCDGGSWRWGEADGCHITIEGELVTAN